MSLRIVFALLSIATVVGLVLGYYLRLIIALGKKGSMELRLRQIELLAKDKEKEIVDDANKKAEEILKEARAEIKEKEVENRKTEDRLIKKEELLDGRSEERRVGKECRS